MNVQSGTKFSTRNNNTSLHLGQDPDNLEGEIWETRCGGKQRFCRQSLSTRFDTHQVTPNPVVFFIVDGPIGSTKGLKRKSRSDYPMRPQKPKVCHIKTKQTPHETPLRSHNMSPKTRINRTPCLLWRDKPRVTENKNTSGKYSEGLDFVTPWITRKPRFLFVCY